MSCQEVNFALGFLCEKLGFEFSRPNSRSGFILNDSASEEAPDYSASRETQIAPGRLEKFAQKKIFTEKKILTKNIFSDRKACATSVSIVSK